MEEGFRRLPDSELAIMQVLWDAGTPLTRAGIDEALKSKKDWAVSTVLNLIARLEGKGYVLRQKQGKGYLYRAAVSEQDYLSRETKSLVEGLYRGRPQSFLAALVEGGGVSADELEELEGYLAALRERAANE